MFKTILKRWFKKQRSQLTVIDCDGAHRKVIHETRDWIEAPNWTPDGQWLVFNGAGRLFRIRADGSQPPEPINTGKIDDITNDHVLSPDGKTIYFTAHGCIYAVAFDGGLPRKASADQSPLTSLQYYVHGISPDGRTLCCVGVAPNQSSGAMAIYTLPTAGGDATQLTHITEPVDGPEFSPDGQWIYFNSELNARKPGHAQIFRMHTDGTHIEQLTTDSRVNWFPHVSPDNRRIAYLSYPENTQGHPANMNVILRTIPATGGEPKNVVALFGGQGTLNTNSWAPNSQHFAYVAYPMKNHRA